MGTKTRTKYQMAPLSSLLKDKPQYGANERAIDGKAEVDVRYIRITDIDKFGNLKDNDWKTARKIDEKYLLEENDILFARSGATAGKTFIYNKTHGKAIFAGYLIRFKIDEDKINPLFVFHYTHLERYLLWIKSIQRPSGQPNINSEEFKSFEIPIIPTKIQDQIIKIIEDAYEEKKEKELQAKLLIDSITPFFYDKLDTKLPLISSKFPRAFTVAQNFIKQKRFDPNYYLPDYIKAIKIIEKSKFPTVPFGDLIDDIANGVEIRNYVENGTPYLRVTEMNVDGMDLSNVKYVAETQKDLSKKIQLEMGDLLISRSGSLGLVDMVKDETIKNSIISSHIIRIVLKKSLDISPDYIMSYLRSVFGQVQFFRNKIGAVVPEISQDALKTFLIIKPPPKIQTMLSTKMENNIQASKKLKNEALEIIEQGYKESEKILS
ncbi:MAG: restriction endonuclease subunit S [Thaumarchaeota archaeon]|nr:restriction endonuclease subunit S [Nitrososphaerota archaeon]